MVTSSSETEASITSTPANSFDRLARTHYKAAYHFAYRITGNRADAEDLVQESLIRAYRFFDRYNSDFPFTSWLYKIMLNANVDLLRRRGRIKTTSLETEIETLWDTIAGFVTRVAAPDEAVMRDEMGEPLQRALLSISAQFRTAVLLADVEGLSYEEIAVIMGTTVGTVRSRVHRGRKQLRKFLVRGQVGGLRELSFEL